MKRENLIKDLSQSKKYGVLGIETIERVVKSLEVKYSSKNLEKEVKSKLHQIWGAFFDRKPNYKKILEIFEQEIRVINNNNLENIKPFLLPILKLHTSTRERVEILDSFYPSIFEITGKPNQISDIGCGLNPLAFSWMNLGKNIKYKAFDIDQNEVEFLNKIFSLIDLNNNFEAFYGDVYNLEIEPVDMVFLLKILPTLEQQQKGISEKLLSKIKAKNIIVSFPIQSIGSRKKGMNEFYSNWFEGLTAKLNFKFTKLEFATELVYIVYSFTVGR